MVAHQWLELGYSDRLFPHLSSSSSRGVSWHVHLRITRTNRNLFFHESRRKREKAKSREGPATSGKILMSIDMVSGEEVLEKVDNRRLVLSMIAD